MSDIKNSSLADQGELRIEWALKEMPVINNLMKQLTTERPLQGLRISLSINKSQPREYVEEYNLKNGRAIRENDGCGKSCD